MARAWLEVAEGAGFSRQVLLGDTRALPAALEGAARELGIAVEVSRMAGQVDQPGATG
jgi:type II secretory pathway component PulL